MSRDFSVIRRRTGILDLVTPKRVDVYGYRFQAATNFDASWTTLFTAPMSSGYLDPAINPAVLHTTNNSRTHIRAVFNPASFTVAAGIVDTLHFWLRFVPVDAAGAPGTAGAPHLVVTDAEHYGSSRILISGLAPQGAAVANSQELELPFTTQDLYIKNEEASGGRNLYIAMIPGGAEQQISPQETLTIFHGPIDSLLVRGVGGTVRFSASFTNYLPL